MSFFGALFCIIHSNSLSLSKNHIIFVPNLEYLKSSLKLWFWYCQNYQSMVKLSPVLNLICTSNTDILASKKIKSKLEETLHKTALQDYNSYYLRRTLSISRIMIFGLDFDWIFKIVTIPINNCYWDVVNISRKNNSNENHILIVEKAIKLHSKILNDV